MRLRLLVASSALAVLGLLSATDAQAQVAGAGIGTDPFSFYYGYYLPHQAAQAAQPRAIDTINQIVATRQYNAQTDRTQLYDPISPYGDEESDPLKPYSGSARRGPGSQPSSFGFGSASTVSSGNGPAVYYNRTARYFPSMRTGRGPNKNLTAHRQGRGSGGGMGMGGMGMGGMGGMGGMN